VFLLSTANYSLHQIEQKNATENQNKLFSKQTMIKTNITPPIVKKGLLPSCLCSTKLLSQIDDPVVEVGREVLVVCPHPVEIDHHMRLAIEKAVCTRLSRDHCLSRALRNASAWLSSLNLKSQLPAHDAFLTIWVS
jgi:hypothetical protein